MYTNIFYLSLIAILGLSACVTHPSPNPKARIATQNYTEEKMPLIEDRSIYFAHNSFTLDKSATVTLNALVKVLKDMPKIRINIGGYASEEGNIGYNLTLSHSRASAVVTYIESKGVKRKQIQVIMGHGTKNAVCTEDTVLCHQKNRRVDIEIANNTQKYQVIDTKVEMLRQKKSKASIKRKLLALKKDRTMPYKIGSGDKFNISIYGEPELTIKGGIVKPDGTLTVSMIGDVKVSGMSINVAMEKISNKLKRYMQKPIVSLIPSEFRAQSYTILGKINKPGNYPVHETSKVLDTIADAGGFSIGIFKDNTIELADLEHAFIRRGTEVLPVDFMELVRKGNPLHNIALEDKDYIYIPSALNTEIYMLGEVKLPGFYGYKERMTLTQLISHAEGYTDKGNINQIAIIRGYLDDPSVYLVDLEKVLEGKGVDFMLKPYDIVFIPKSTVGDWNTMLDLLTPSLETLTNGYIATQLLRGNN